MTDTPRDSVIKAALGAQPLIHSVDDALSVFEQGRRQGLIEALAVCESTYPEMDGKQLPCFDTAVDCADAIRRLVPSADARLTA
jgi:hypothetical protein